MKYKIREQISVNKSNVHTYPYQITISMDRGISVSIWLDESQFQQLLWYMQWAKSSDSPYNGGIVVSEREYEA